MYFSLTSSWHSDVKLQPHKMEMSGHALFSKSMLSMSLIEADLLPNAISCKGILNNVGWIIVKRVQ